jgi:hypothetical protein
MDALGQRLQPANKKIVQAGYAAMGQFRLSLYRFCNFSTVSKDAIHIRLCTVYIEALNGFGISIA